MSEQVVAGRYRLERRLGPGGMSEVWAAEDLELGRAVALKILGPEADPVRFEREARAAAALAHPNVTQLFDYGKWEGRPYMVLELLPGGTLEDRLRDGAALPDDETARIAGEIAAGLAHAHERGLVHRDLKPANILFDADGHAKIADFGIARIGGAGTLTEAGTLLGTAAYISPEQAAGEPATAASDVYAFGVILFRMLTGRLPFEAEEPLELVALHRDAEPPAVEAIRPDAPPRLARLANTCLVKDPRARPPDGNTLTAALDEAAYGAEAATEVLAPAAGPTAVMRVPTSRRPVRVRRGRLAALLLALLAAAGAGVAIAVLGNGSSSQPATSATGRHTTTRSTRSTSTESSTRTSTTTTSRSTTTPSTTTRPTTTRPTTTRPTSTRPTSTQPTTTIPTSTLPTTATSTETTITLPTP